MDSDTPQCTGCAQVLDRVDRYYIERLVLDNNVYRELHALEGVASTVGLRCGHCGTDVDPEVRRFFYERDWKLLEYMAQNGLRR